jgi:hypothetical protein
MINSMRTTDLIFPGKLPEKSILSLRAKTIPLIGMCSRIRYRKLGDYCECILISDCGDVEVLGKGTMEEIVQYLSENGLGAVNPSLIEQDIHELCSF